MAVHGIRNEDLDGKKPFERSDFYAKVNELNSPTNYLIAHNLPFDLGKLEYYGFSAKCKLIDTLQCAKHLFEIGEKLGEYEYALPNYKLQTFRYVLFSKADEAQMASKYGADIKAHNAIGDVIILKMFFNELLKKVEQEHSNFSLEESLEYLSELSKKPVLIKTFAFGKYKGKLIKDVAEQDIGYINWLYGDIKKRKNSGESIDENMYNTLKAILEQ
jgi:DNA polymerase-3 subunit epsilon/exodeoxyribonuclease X